MTSGVEPLRLAVTCGGTGGHFYPGLSIARTLIATGGEAELLLSGVNSAAQCAVAQSRQVPALMLPLMPSPGSPGKALRFCGGLAGGFRTARRELIRFRPQALLGMGSFASLPAILAARSLGIPVFLHDGNARIGKANRWLSRGARLLGTAFPAVNADSCRCRVVCTGMPVRPELLQHAGISRNEAFAGLEEVFHAGFDPGKPLFLITGGSQGASVFNNVCPAALRQIGGDSFQVLHLAGPRKVEEARQAYAGVPFKVLVLPGTERMELAFGAADLVLSRSGGSTVAELALFGKAAILIPYPYAAEGHQTDNARFLADAGAALLLPNAECTIERATELFRDFLEQPDAWRRRAEVARSRAMPDAAERLLQEISRAFSASDGNSC